MSELKHTPGPWYVANNADQTIMAGTPDEPIDWICIPQKGLDASPANARLMAAAPELLVAAKECADALADIINAAGNGQPYSADELVRLFADVRCRGDKAVAKATGERI